MLPSWSSIKLRFGKCSYLIVNKLSSKIKIVLRGGKNFTLLLLLAVGREFLRLGSSGSSQKFCIQLRNYESCPSNKSGEIPPL